MAPSGDGRTIYFHIGLPKTGTTFLQRGILPSLEGIDLLVKPKFSGLSCYPGYGGFGAIFGYSPAIWSHLGDQFLEQVLGSRVIHGNGPVLISDENVSIALRYPSDYATVDALPRSYDVFGVARHFEEMRRPLAGLGFTRIRLILTIRRQDTWLASAYAQDSHCWPDAGQQHFEAWVHDFLESRKGYWINGVTLDYDLTCCVLAEVVGSQDLLILPYELLRQDPRRFLGHWVSFMGMSDRSSGILTRITESGHLGRSNVRSQGDGRWELRPKIDRSSTWGRVRRKAGGIAARVAKAAVPGRKPPSIRLTEALSSRILSAYAGSNQTLESRVGLDLQAHGYWSPE